MTNDSRIAVGRNQDGRWEIFSVGLQDELYQTWQQLPTLRWSETRSRQKTAKSLVVGRNKNDGLEAIYIGTDNKLYRFWQPQPNAALSEWGDFDDREVEALALATHTGNRLEVFYIEASSHNLYHRWQDLNGAWQGPNHFFGAKAKAIAVASKDGSDENLLLFFADESNDIFYQEQLAGAWQTAAPLTAKGKSIVAGRGDEGRLTAFFIGMDDTLCYKSQTGDASLSWSAEASLDLKVKDLVVGQGPGNGFELFCLGQDGKIYHLHEATGMWSKRTVVTDGGAAFATARKDDGLLELFYLREDGRLYHNVQTAADAWTGERPLHTDELWFVTGHQLFDPGPGMHINDHCFIYDSEGGRWHVFGIEAANTGYQAPPDRSAGHFFHASAEKLTDRHWRREPDALVKLDTESALWAPHVLKGGDDRYYMFYCNGSDGGDNPEKYRISLALSDDLIQWTRHDLPLFEDGFQARDPMVMWNVAEEKWVLYYTATKDPGSKSPYVVACRTSTDLFDWSSPRIVYEDRHLGQFYGPTESPYVVQRGGYYYLFIGPRPYRLDEPTSEAAPPEWLNWRDRGYDGTDVFRSRRWDKWTDEDYVGHIPAHAAEVVRDLNGDWYVSHAGLFRGGVYLLSLHWRDGLDES